MHTHKKDKDLGNKRKRIKKYETQSRKPSAWVVQAPETEKQRGGNYQQNDWGIFPQTEMPDWKDPLSAQYKWMKINLDDYCEISKHWAKEKIL